MPTNDKDQRVLSRRLEGILIAFFLVAALFLLVVYFADPSIYANTLLLKPSPTDRYPLPVTLFLVAILVFIAVLIVGVLRHWRWLFWLILIAFGFSILQIPATILQLTGVVPGSLPVWYRSTGSMEFGPWGRRRKQVFSDRLTSKRQTKEEETYELDKTAASTYSGMRHFRNIAHHCRRRLWLVRNHKRTNRDTFSIVHRCPRPALCSFNETLQVRRR